MAAVFAVIIELNLEDLYRYLGINPIRHFWLYITLTAFVTAAFVEEAIKLWVVKTHAYNNESFNEVMDGITYTIIASMGFATFENFFYVLEGGFTIALIRALISVPAHALFSGVMGYYIGKAKFAKTPGASTKLILVGFAYGVLYHGLFDFFLFTQSILIFLVLPLLIVMGLHLRSKIKLAHFHDKVTDVMPAKMTAGRIIRVIIATVLIGIGTISAVASVVLYGDPLYDYTGEDIIYGFGFAFILYLISFYLLSKKPKKLKEV